MKCSGPQSTGCLFRSAVSALVARHAHVGGDPLQDNVGATSNELVAHDDNILNDVFSGRLTAVFDGLQRRQRVGKNRHRQRRLVQLVKKFNAMRMATNSTVEIETCVGWYFFVQLLSCGTTNAAPTPSVVTDPSVYTQIQCLYLLLISSLAVTCKIRGLSDLRRPAISNSIRAPLHDPRRVRVDRPPGCPLPLHPPPPEPSPG